MKYSDNIFENDMEPKSHRRFLSPLLHDSECNSECYSDYDDNDENNSYFDNEYSDSEDEEVEENVEEEIEESLEKEIKEHVEEEIEDVENEVKEHVEEEVKEHVEEEVKEHVEEEVKEHVDEEVKEHVNEEVKEHVDEEVKEHVDEEIEEIEKKKETEKIKFHKDCSICQEMLKPTLLKCGHSFHPTCINKWFAINKSCPICRIDASDKSDKSVDDDWVNVRFDDFDVFHRKLTSGKLYRITYKLVNGVERTVRMKKFMGIKDVAKPSHNSPLLVIKIFEDNFDRKIYYGKITNVQKRS